jgi:colanic acid/amylovoran biosynthesis glycosyltransferase
MRVCISVSDRDIYSETFIRDHINRLPCETIAIFGEGPTTEYNERRIVPLLLRVLSKAAPITSSWQDGAIASFLRRERIEVVMAEYGTTAVPLIAACRKAGVPLVVHFHGFDAYNQSILAEHREGYRSLFEDASGIIAGSHAMEQHLLELGARREVLFYNPCGVDCALFARVDSSANPPTFIAVGRFVDKKAPHLTILAFERVHRVCPETRLVMIGAGALLDACRQMAVSLGLECAIEFKGTLEHRAVAEALRRGRAFVQHSVVTSYGDSEGTGLTVLEAGASGLPVVATRHGGIQESVIHGETGFLVDERDTSGMADYMIQLAREPQLAGQMGRRARAHVETNFSMESSISNLFDILKRCRNRDR